MNIVKLLIVPAVLAAVIVGGKVNVSAQSTNPHDTADCYITGLPHYRTHGDSFTINGLKASSTFEVKGDESCQKVITIASWEAPNGTDGTPYEEQKLYKYNTGTFGVGRHTMTVELPDCYYQVDIVRFANPTAEDGGPVYENHRLLDFKHGGNKPCGEEPVKPEKPVKEVTVAETELPNTGPGSVLGLSLGVGTAAGILHRIRNRRSNRK